MPFVPFLLVSILYWAHAAPIGRLCNDLGWAILIELLKEALMEDIVIMSVTSIAALRGLSKVD